MNKELENTTPDTEIDSIPEIDQMLAWVYKCGWYASNDWNDWTKDIEAVIRKAKRQIEKIIKERVKSEVNKVLDEATKEIRGHISAASENQRYHEENTKNERLAREYKGANDGLILAESAIEKVRRRWK